MHRNNLDYNRVDWIEWSSDNNQRQSITVGRWKDGKAYYKIKFDSIGKKSFVSFVKKNDKNKDQVIFVNCSDMEDIRGIVFMSFVDESKYINLINELWNENLICCKIDDFDDFFIDDKKHRKKFDIPYYGLLIADDYNIHDYYFWCDCFRIKLKRQDFNVLISIKTKDVVIPNDDLRNYWEHLIQHINYSLDGNKGDKENYYDIDGFISFFANVQNVVDNINDTNKIVEFVKNEINNLK